MKIWKPINGFEWYQVSDSGDVINTVRNLPLKQHKDKDGYKRVILRRHGEQKNFFVHRLVAEAFIPNPDNLPCVNHKDENKANNRAENLEWCSVQYNTTYHDAHLKRTKSLKKAVIQYDASGSVVRVWSSASEAAKALGKSRGNINACCLHLPHFKTAYGYRWEYVK